MRYVDSQKTAEGSEGSVITKKRERRGGGWLYCGGDVNRRSLFPSAVIGTKGMLESNLSENKSGCQIPLTRCHHDTGEERRPVEHLLLTNSSCANI